MAYKIKIFLLTIVATVLFASCDNNNYEYESGIRKYFSEIAVF